jgi:uracil phosphoribosyltransferase
VALEQRSDGSIVVPFNALPEVIPERAGVLVFAPQVASAARLLHLLELLEARGVEGVRVRVITTVAASPGLKRLGERFGELTLYTGCIDAELDDAGQILPGVGDPEGRLCGLSGPTFVG